MTLAGEDAVPSVPSVVWEPSVADAESSRVGAFVRWLAQEHDRSFDGYEPLWRWSVEEPAEFWESVWQFFAVPASAPYSAVLEDQGMPGARWFPGARLNYAEVVLDRAPADRPAIVAVAEDLAPREISRDELRGRVGALAAALRDLGVGSGDRVAGYLPNIPEAVVAMLAAASIGAVWTSCSPDFGLRSVVDRLAQVEPVVLVAVDGYRWAGKDHDRRTVVEQLRGALPTVRTVIVVQSLDPAGELPPAPGTLRFADLVSEAREPVFAQVEFDSPLWVLFSSGTTGLPKGIMHSHGGIVVEHLKALGLCLDLRAGDTFLFPSSTSWMAWNFLIGGLLHGATVVLYDGSPAHPSDDALWQLAVRTGATVLGMGAAYVTGCARAGVTLPPGGELRVRTVIPTGAPLPIGGWRWLGEQLAPHVRIDSICGGTDVCTAFFGGSPLLPVWEGEISARWLGVAAAAYDPDGQPVIDEVGEFVVTTPMPSMPVSLWNDPDGSRYRSSYFGTYEGVWRQGDWITVTGRGSVVVSGRSDATLNRGGVRLGSAEIYGVVESLPEVHDSLVVGVELPDGGYAMSLFVVPAADVELDDGLRDRITVALRGQLSPRHVPDEIVAAPAIPRTLTGKKLEVPVKRLLQGSPIDRVVSADAVDRPDVLPWFAGRATAAAGDG